MRILTRFDGSLLQNGMQHLPVFFKLTCPCPPLHVPIALSVSHSLCPPHPPPAPAPRADLLRLPGPTLSFQQFAATMRNRERVAPAQQCSSYQIATIGQQATGSADN